MSIFLEFFSRNNWSFKKLLKGLNKKFNITLFHYRDIGTDNADVLIGIENIGNELDEINKDLENIGYKFTTNQIMKHTKCF